MSVRCQTDTAKRMLRDHLRDHDRDMAEFFDLVEAEFGPAVELTYSGPTELALRATLDAMRRAALREALNPTTVRTP